MANVKKMRYYKPRKGLFGLELTEYKGRHGCIQLDTQKRVSIERPAPGQKPARVPPDLREFHNNWQFQFLSITNWDTLENLSPTDLTGALASFNIYIAIGNVEVSSEKYFKYEKSGNTYCINATGKITHVYAYVKDNYSFNGEQYLGHWNKYGVIIAPGSLLTRASSTKRDSDLDIWSRSINKPVDTQKSLFGKFRKSDVYFPVYNADYNRWRATHHRGNDFMIYSKPVRLKLKKPIDLDLGEICRVEPSDTLG